MFTNVHQCSPMFTNVHQCSPSLIPRYSKISQVSHVLCGLDDHDIHDPNLPRSAQISDLPAFCHGTSFGSFHPALSQAQRLIRGVCVNVAHITPCHTPTITVEVCLMGVSYAVASKTVRTFSLSGAVGGKQITNAIRPRSALKQSWSRLVNTWQIAAVIKHEAIQKASGTSGIQDQVMWYDII